MIKFTSDLLQVGGFHDKVCQTCYRSVVFMLSWPVTCYRQVVFMIKFTSDLLQVDGFHDKVGQ